MVRNQGHFIHQMEDKEVLFHLYMTQLLLIFISAVLGFFLFPDFESLLSLFQWDVDEIVYIGVGCAIFVICVDLVLMKIFPTYLYDDGGVNEKVFKNRPIWHIILIASVVASSEELLFRGVIQTHFGLIIASVVFAVLHLRYLAKWLLFIVVVSLSFLLGWLFLVTENLFVTITAHFLIDFVFGLIIRIKHTRFIHV